MRNKLSKLLREDKSPYVHTVYKMFTAYRWRMLLMWFHLYKSDFYNWPAEFVCCINDIQLFIKRNRSQGKNFIIFMLASIKQKRQTLHHIKKMRASLMQRIHEPPGRAVMMSQEFKICLCGKKNLEKHPVTSMKIVVTGCTSSSMNSCVVS